MERFIGIRIKIMNVALININIISCLIGSYSPAYNRSLGNELWISSHHLFVNWKSGGELAWTVQKMTQKMTGTTNKQKINLVNRRKKI